MRTKPARILYSEGVENNAPWDVCVRVRGRGDPVITNIFILRKVGEHGKASSAKITTILTLKCVGCGLCVQCSGLCIRLQNMQYH